MNTFLFASVSSAWLLAGWTMIHFLWFGTLVAVFAFLCRWMLRRAPANVRYAIALGCLMVLAALPIAIAAWLHEHSAPLQADSSSMQESTNQPPHLPAITQPVRDTRLQENTVIDLRTPRPVPTTTGPAESTPTTPRPTAASITPPTTSSAPPATNDPVTLAIVAINTAARYLPWLWLIGTPLTFSLTATGLIGTRRLRLSSRPVIDGPIAEALERLAATLRLGKRVSVAVCDRIAAPVLIGIVRPIILLPPAALTGYSPDEIEMVLLHELAHVRRWDNLINLAQRLVESVLFFHPAVWLVSSWARREREACCDAFVVARTRHPHAYAELLVALAAQMPRSVLFHPAASSAMAAGPLRSRIRRILGLDDDPMLISGKSFTLVLGALLTAAAIAILYVPSIGQAEQSTTDDTKRLASHEKEQADESAALPRHAETKNKMAIATRDRLEKRLQELQAEIKRKYEDYLDIAKSGDAQSSDRNPESDLLLRDVAHTQRTVQDLTTAFHRLHADYVVARDGLSDPALFESQADEAIKSDPQYAILQQQLTSALQTAGSDSDSQADSIKRKLELYRADFRKKTIQGLRSKPNVPLQQLTRRFKTQADSLKKQLVVATQNLEQKKRELEKRVGKSVDLEKRGEGLKKLQQAVNDISVELERVDIALVDPIANGSIDVDPAEEARLKSLFTVGKDNPLQTRTHEVPQSLRKILPDTFEGLRNDPYGPQLKFEVKWNADHSQVEITAPRYVQQEIANQIKTMAASEEKIAATPKAAPATAKKEQILETLPADWQQGPDTQSFYNSFTAALNRNVRPDIIYRDGKALLVATPQPTEKDWPDMLGDPPRKERVIGEKVWQMLGLKIAPLNNAEITYYQMEGKNAGVMIVGGNVPKGLPLPAILTRLDSFVPTTMDSMLEWTSNGNGQPAAGVKCYAIVSGKEYLFESQPPVNAPPEKQNDPLTAPVRAAAPPHRFPSLEDQKIADLIWKRLSLELEPIGPEDLKRVKALGYEGGLRLSDFSKAAAQMDQGSFTEGDILVGLHVWPTRNMNDVTEILCRDDLAELSPLKFYVVRNPASPTEGDVVHTGRMRVNLPDSAANEASRRPALIYHNDPDQNSYIKPQPPAAPSDTPLFSGNTTIPTPSTPSPPVPPTNLTGTNRVSPAAPLAPPKVAVAETKPNLTSTAIPPTAAVSTDEATIRKANPYYQPGANRLLNPNDATNGSKSTSAKNGDANRADSPANRLKIAVYTIPKDLAANVKNLTFDANLLAEWDEQGRLYMQASPKYHDKLRNLLADTPKWRDPAAAKDRAAKPIEMRKIDGQDALEWRTAGLTLMHDSQRGVYVAKVAPGSPAAWNDIELNDSLGEVGRFRVTSLTELESILKAVAESYPKDKSLPTVIWHRKPEGDSVPLRKYFSPGPEATPAKSANLKETGPTSASPPTSSAPTVSPNNASATSAERRPVVTEKATPANTSAAATRRPDAHDSQKSPSNLAIAVYTIPKELISAVRQFTGSAHLVAEWDEQGRVLLQADPEMHAQFKNLLAATPKWREAAAAQHRADKPLEIEIRKVKGQDVLDWPSVGLSFTDAPINDDSQPKGVRIVEVAPGSPAAWAGLSLNDRLVAVGNFAAHNLSGLESVLKAFAESYPKLSSVDVTLHYRDAYDRNVYKRATLSLRSAGQTTKSSPPNATSQTTTPQKPSPDSPPLLYDGKPFYGWRDAWQNELSVEKRSQAVKALAAFGRTGYGEETAKTLLDVAGEYNFADRADDSPEEQLKDQITATLAPGEGDQPLVKYWLPDLAQRLQREPDKWAPLASTLLSTVRATDRAAIDVLRDLAQNKSMNKGIRSTALRQLVFHETKTTNPSRLGDQTRALIDEWLASNDWELVTSGLEALIYQPSRSPSSDPRVPATPLPTATFFRPDQLSLLFHSNELVRDVARANLRFVAPKDTPPFVQKLIEKLKDPSLSSEDKIAALRAVAVLGKFAKDAHDSVKKIFDQAEQAKDEKVQLAATLALTRIGDEHFKYEQIDKNPILRREYKKAMGEPPDEPEPSPLSASPKTP